MFATDLKKTGAYARPKPAGPIIREPANLNLLRKLLDSGPGLPLPIRTQGAGSASTDCNTTTSGTTLKMTGLDRIIKIDTHNQTVTAQAHRRLRPRGQNGRRRDFRTLLWPEHRQQRQLFFEPRRFDEDTAFGRPADEDR